MDQEERVLRVVIHISCTLQVLCVFILRGAMEVFSPFLSLVLGTFMLIYGAFDESCFEVVNEYRVNATRSEAVFGFSRGSRYAKL